MMALIFGGIIAIPSVVRAESPDRLKLIYFGNSLTACAQPDLHDELGESAGKTWDVTSILGAGWQVNFHRFALLAAGLDITEDGKLTVNKEKFEEQIGDVAELARDRGDLTIDPGVARKMEGKFRRFISEEYDGMLLQFFHAPLHFMREEHMGVEFNEPRDIGELPACIDMIRMYLAMNPGGTIYIYQNWPHMPETFPVPPEGERPDWARREGARLARAEFPDREEFDYEHEWLEKEYSPDHPDRPWKDNLRCKDIGDQLFEGLKAEFPNIWKEGRLQMIPVGDIWLELHRKMKVGEFPGFDDIEKFYTDIQHTRIGLARYSAAAAFYAVMFRDKPHNLDWQIYNSKEAYINRWDRQNGYDLNHDKGELLEITPETAEIVNDVTWEVLNEHPYVKM